MKIFLLIFNIHLFVIKKVIFLVRTKIKSFLCKLNMLVKQGVEFRRVQVANSLFIKPEITIKAALAHHFNLDPEMTIYPSCATLNYIIYQMVGEFPFTLCQSLQFLTSCLLLQSDSTLKIRICAKKSILLDILILSHGRIPLPVVFTNVFCHLIIIIALFLTFTVFLFGLTVLRVMVCVHFLIIIFSSP